MEFTSRLVLAVVHKKISMNNNTYFELGFKEETNLRDDKGNLVVRNFERIYMPECKDENELKERVGKEVKAKFLCFQHSKIVNGKTYHDVKLSCIDIDDINERVSGNTEE